jgi:hypothetical protein
MKTQANTEINEGATQFKSSLKTETSSESTLPVPPPTGFAVDFNQHPSFLNLPSHITFSDKKDVALFEENSPIFQAGMPHGFASNSTPEFLDNLGQVTKKAEDDGDEAHNYGCEDSLDERGDFSLPPPSTRCKNLPIQDAIYDSGAMMTTCNKGPRCTDLRASNIDVNGAFADEGGSGKVETCASNYLYKLDDGEIAHLLVPNTIAVPPDKLCATLICNAQVLEAGHAVSEKSSGSLQTQLHFVTGGTATLPTINAHPILQLQPVDPRHLEHHNFR